MLQQGLLVLFFFFNDTATTEIYTLSLHDALPIYGPSTSMSSAETAGMFTAVETTPPVSAATTCSAVWTPARACASAVLARSEEHTSELQSRPYLVCRLLLEKKKIHSEPEVWRVLH